MSRRAHDQKVVDRAKELRAEGWSYYKISRFLYTEFKVDVGTMTVRDWVTKGSRDK